MSKPCCGAIACGCDRFVVTHGAAREAEIARLKAEVLEARNEAATVRRAYLHEKKRAEDAIQWLRAYEPGPASVLAKRAYVGPAEAMCSGKALDTRDPVRKALDIPPEISSMPELGWDGKPVR